MSAIWVQTLFKKYRSWDTTITVFSKLIRNSSSHAMASRSRWLVGSSSSRISGFPNNASVSYTHLDVYKRQFYSLSCFSPISRPLWTMAEQQRKIPYMSSIISYPALFVNFNRAFRMALYGFCKGSFHFSFSFHLEDIYYISVSYTHL